MTTMMEMDEKKVLFYFDRFWFSVAYAGHVGKGFPAGAAQPRG